MDIEKKLNEILAIFKISPSILTISLSFLVLMFYLGGIFISVVILSLSFYKTYTPGPLFHFEMYSSLPLEDLDSSENDPKEVAVEIPVVEPTEAENLYAVEEATSIPEATEESFTNTVPDFPLATPTLAPTVIVSEIIFEPDEISSPISGVEIYELSSIISQAYNVPNPFSDNGHHGVDFGSYNFRGNYLLGWPIQAVFTGKVVGITVDKYPIGNTIILETPYSQLPENLREVMDIQPDESLYHLYAHMMDPPELEIGQEVECGEIIGKLGQSQTAEAHLHFETRIGISGLTVPSMSFYDTSATEDEMETYLWWRTSGIVMPFDPMSIFSNVR